MTTLLNGVTLANLSSPHTFTFDDGTVLGACSPARARALMLDTEESESEGIGGTTDIELSFVINDKVSEAISRLQADDRIDLIVTPLPVMLALRAAGIAVGKCRSVRMADRVTKVVHSSRWCKA